MAFATATDVQARLGLASLTEEQATQVNYLLDAATGLIAQAADKDDTWAANYDAPASIQALCVELVTRVFVNPNAAEITDERLGQYELRQQFSVDTAGMMLSEKEILFVRRVVWGTASTSISTEVDSHASVDYPWARSLQDLGPDDPAYYIGGDTG